MFNLLAVVQYPTKPNEPIMPGKTGKIEVKYNMAPGPIRKTITVETNAVNYEGGRVASKNKRRSYCQLIHHSIK